MLPVSLLIWLILEIGGYLYFGRHVLGVDWAAASVGAVGGLLGVRAGINAITWVFGMALASPAPRLGFSRTARLMFDEYLAFLLTFVLVIPFERLWMPADRLSKGKQPILLVHGYGCSRGVWWLLRRRLEAAGHTVASVSLAPPHISLGRLEPILSQRIEAVCAATGSPQVTLIGHSMGGLIARKALTADRPDPIQNPHTALRLVTVSAPFSGIASARMCGVPAMRVATLGLNDLVCWLISGDNWHEITSASNFIRQPGGLVSQVNRHLKVVTDERDACRRRNEAGACIESDYIFSLAEQRYPPVTLAPATTDVEVIAGHVEIVGESGVTPHKLIDVFQREGVVLPTPPERRAAFRALLARLYGR